MMARLRGGSLPAAAPMRTPLLQCCNVQARGTTGARPLDSSRGWRLRGGGGAGKRHEGTASAAWSSAASYADSRSFHGLHLKSAFLQQLA